MKLNVFVRLLCVTVLVAQLLPISVVAASSSAPADKINSPAEARSAADVALPRWFTSPAAGAQPLSNAASPLPGWFASPSGSASAQPIATGNALPGWFTGLASPPLRPLQLPIPESLLTVNVYGPPVASLGSPVGAGELYTAVVRNNSTQIAYAVYLTSTHQTYFIHDGGDQIITGTGATTATIPFTLTISPTAITWTPQITVDLAPGQVLTLNFKLRAACDAQSGQQMRVGVYYNADPAQPPIELNTAGLNITTGRGNLVIKKEPALQNLGTTDFGKPITWTVTVQNTGLGILYGAVVTDTGGINLAQPSGDLNPTATIPMLNINQIVSYTVVGRVEACNFTNVAQAAWTCGNLAGDATASNPVSSTTSVLFTPQIPRINIQVSSPITFPYCSPLTRTVTLSIENSGGPAGNFRLDSDLESNAFLDVITSSISSGWQYNPASGVFSYTGGSPTGTIPALNVGSPVTLSFQVRPRASVCAAGSGSVVFEPLYNDVCSGDLFRANPVNLNYQYAQGEAPNISIVKSGPGLVRSGETFFYQVIVTGENGINLAGLANMTDVIPSEFQFTGLISASIGTFTTTGQSIIWNFDPPNSYGPFSATLTYQVQSILTKTQCGASQIVNNNAQVTAHPTCPGCPLLADSDDVDTAVVNNEGISASRSYAGSTEACGVGGLTLYNQYVITGSTIVTWTGATFVDALGADMGGGALPPGAPPLNYVSGTLQLTVNGTDYAAYVTPTVNVTGQLVIDLTPLQAAGAPTQNVTLLITYTVTITEGSLSGLVSQTFYDWTRLYLPGLSDNGCADNNTFNQALELTIGRGDLLVAVEPQILNRCGANPVTIRVSDNAPGRITDHIVVTFTSSIAEIMSARNFNFTGSLAPVGPISIVTDTTIGGGRGVITFTLPVAADLDGDGTIQFEVDVNCAESAVWDAGISFQSLCAVPYAHTATRDHVYRAPDLTLFATPIQYTVRTRDVIWKWFIANNGNLTATNVVVTNAINGLAVLTFSANSGSGSISLTASPPITAPDPAVFAITQLAPGEQREVTVTARVIQCNPLYVDIIARLDCFGTTCTQLQRHVDFNTPDPYLVTNNGQTADLPMCDVGTIVFRTKNASSDISLYQLDITETLRNLTPDYTQPFTLSIVDRNGSVITTTTAFTPVSIPSGSDLLLIWQAISAPMGIFDVLDPLSVVVITVPVRIGCALGTPQSFASASALGPCGKQLGYTENAVTLQTQQPDMTITKEGRGPTGDFGETVYANPGDTVVWRIRVENRPTAHAYVARNVILSDTWPSNFQFITATLDYNPTIIAASNTITWAIGDVAVGSVLYFYITGTLTGDSCQATTINRALLNFGCDDGCTSSLAPMDTANLDSQPNPQVILSPGPLSVCQGDIPITIRNLGAAAYTNTLTVTLPPGYVYSETVGASLPPDSSGGVGTSSPWFAWNVIPGRVNPNPYYEFTLTLRVRNSGTSGACPIEDGRPVTATLEYNYNPTCAPNPGPLSTTASVNLNVVEPTLQIAKTPHAQTGDVGRSITWTIRLTNTGSGIAEQVVVTDVLGSNYTNPSATNGSDGSPPTIVGNVITWTPSNIPVGGSWTATVSAILASLGDNRNVVTATAGCATGCQTASVTDTALTTLLQNFAKNPEIQTGTIGSLVVFTFTAALPDWDALYERVTLTDTLPTGLGYVASILNVTYDADGNSGGPLTLISTTPTLSPTAFASGNVVWWLGDLSGTVQVNGVLTAVIQNIPSNYDSVRLTNLMTLTYSDDGQPYVYTDTASVDVLEPLLHIGKSYITPYGCGATLLEDNFNDGDANGWVAGSGTWNVVQGEYRTSSSGATRLNGNVAWTDYSFSAMLRGDATGTARSRPGLYVRYTDANNYVLLYWSSDTNLRLRQRVGGVNTDSNLAYAFTPGTWYHVEVQAVGNLVRVWINGTQVFNTSISATLAAGRVGLYNITATGTGTAVARFDDILVTRLGNQSCYVGAGDLVTYTLTISNQARLPAYDLVITDVIPNGTSLVTYTLQSNDPASAVTAEPFPIPGATGALVWGVNQLTPTAPFNPLSHTSLTLTVVLQVSSGITANTVLSNQAFLTYDAWPGATQPTTITRPYSGGSHSTAVRTVVPALIKSVTSPTATLGSLITYTLLLPQPPITATVYSAVVTDRLDSRLMLLSVQDGPDGAVEFAGNTFTVTYASIPAGEQRSITVTAVVSSPQGAVAGNVISNVAVLSHTTGVTTSNQPVFTVTEPALVLVKSSEPPTSNTVSAGQRVTYTVRITNSSAITASPAYDVVFTDTLPLGMRDAAPTLIALTLNGAPVPGSDYATGYDSTGGVFTITFSPAFSVPVSGRLVIQYVAIVDSDVQAAIDLTNQAEATYSSLPGPMPGDRDYGPITSTTTVHTPQVTGLSKSAAPPTVSIGSQVVMSIALPTPPIGANLYNVVLTDVVDGRLQIDAVSPNATFSGQTVTAFFAAIPTYTQQLVIITATVRDLITVTNGTLITNAAQLDYAGNPTGPIPSNVVTVTVVEPNVTLDKSVQTPRDPVGAGDIVTYTLALANTGAWPAFDVIITDALPTGVTFIATQEFTLTDPTTATLSGDYPVWTVSQLNVGGSVWITFTAQVAWDIGAGVLLTNTAWGVYDTQPGDTPGEREYPIVTDTVPIVTGQPALDLEKTAAPSPVQAGGLLTYTLTVINTGIVSATGVVVTDVVPVNTTYLSCGPLPCGEASGTVSWTLGVLDIGVLRVLTMMVQVDSPLPNGAILTNTAWVTSTEGITDTDDITTPVASSHALAIVKTASPSPVQAGDLLTYTLAWSVTGNEPALNVTISDTVPANTSYVLCSGAPCSLNGSTVLWSLGDQNPPASGSVMLVVQVNSPLVSGTLIANAVLISDTQGITDTDDITTPVQSSHNLAIVKTASPSPVQAGDLLTYTLAWSVTGNEPALNVTISDTVPADTSYVSCNGTPCSLNGSTVLWSLGDQNPPASGSVMLVVQVNSPLVSGTLIANVVLISDTQGITDTDDITTPVQSSHNLAIVKTASPSPVQAGDLLTYTLAWSVTGNEPALGVTISDTVPQHTNYQSCDGASCSLNGSTVLWTLGTLNPPASGIVTLTVRVDSPLITGTQIYNAVLISDTQGITDTDDITTPVGSAHALHVTKSASPDPVTAGGLLTYTIAWNVSGNEPAPGVMLSDTIPTSTTYQSCAPIPCGESGGIVTWSLGTLYPVTAGIALLVVRVDANLPAGSVLTNVVSITDTSGLTDTDDITTPVTSVADLAVVKADDPDPVIPGTLLTYTLVVTNLGPSAAINVIVTDTLPAEVTFVSAIPAPGSTAPLVWSLGTLTPAEVRLITVTVQVRPEVTQTFTNTVVVDSETPDDNPPNNTDDEPTTPLVPGLELIKSVTPGQAVRHMPFTYTIRITNTGQITFNPLMLSDNLPPSFYYVPGSGSPRDPDTIAEPTLVWNNLGPLAPSAAITVSFAVTAEMGITGTYINVATVTGTTPGGVLTDTDDVPVVLQDPAVTIDKQLVAADLDDVAPNLVTFTIAITNVGISVIDVLPLLDQYDPYYLSFVAAAPYPEEDANDGLLTWHDLTGPAPHGFGRNLAPGESFLITTVFSVAHDITTTFNTAIVGGAIDVYDNPTNRPTDTVPIINVPTAVELLYFRVDGISGRQVRLAWATAVEIDNFGFNLYRADVNDRSRAQLVHFEPAAAQAHRLGATYVYTDTVPTDGVWWYWLADVDTRGNEAHAIQEPVRAEVNVALPYRIYLPLVFRRP